MANCHTAVAIVNSFLETFNPNLWNSAIFQKHFWFDKKDDYKIEVLYFVLVLITLFDVTYFILVLLGSHCFICIESCNIGLYVAITILCLHLLEVFH